MNKDKLEKTLSVIAVVLALITLLFGDNIYERFTGNSISDYWHEIFTPVEETTSNEQVTPEATSSTVYFFDDFNSGTDFNKALWEKSENEDCDVQLTNRQARFSSTGLNSSNTLCLINAEPTFFEDTGIAEARIKTSSGATGDYSIGIIEFSKGTFDEGSQNWIIQCGILQIPNNQNQIETFFNVHSTYPQGEPEIYKSVSALPEHWYTVKLEIIPETNRIVCYVDNQVIGTYEGSNLADLHQEKLNRHVLGFWSPYSQATFLVDDVEFSRPK